MHLSRHSSPPTPLQTVRADEAIRGSACRRNMARQWDDGINMAGVWDGEGAVRIAPHLRNLAPSSAGCTLGWPSSAPMPADAQPGLGEEPTSSAETKACSTHSCSRGGHAPAAGASASCAMRRSIPVHPAQAAYSPKRESGVRGPSAQGGEARCREGATPSPSPPPSPPPAPAPTLSLPPASLPAPLVLAFVLALADGWVGPVCLSDRTLRSRSMLAVLLSPAANTHVPS